MNAKYYAVLTFDSTSPWIFVTLSSFSCMDRPSTRLESRTEGCITNCVERFIDANNFVANRLQKVATTSGL
ncbi:Mitochondrial import inner membrane translocase subunit Tim8 A-like, partial [Homarus americanus]